MTLSRMSAILSVDPLSATSTSISMEPHSPSALGVSRVCCLWCDGITQPESSSVGRVWRLALNSHGAVGTVRRLFSTAGGRWLLVRLEEQGCTRVLAVPRVCLDTSTEPAIPCCSCDGSFDIPRRRQADRAYASAEMHIVIASSRCCPIPDDHLFLWKRTPKLETC